MEGIKYVNLIEMGLVVIEIRGVENGELAVPLNNTLVRHTAFLAIDTRPCVLMIYLSSYHIGSDRLMCRNLKFIWHYRYIANWL